MTQHFSTTM